LFKKKSLFKAHTDIKIQSMHLNNGDEQNIQLGKVNYIDNSDHNLCIPQCMMGDIDEL